MPITRDGLRYIGSRISGPSSHFIAVTFADEKGEVRFVSVDDPQGDPDPDKVSVTKAALAEMSDRIPVSGRFYPIELGLTERDTADAFHYRAILSDILRQAETELN